MSNVPDGWTDDMSIAVANGRTLEQLVEDVFVRSIQHDSASTIVQHLCDDFGLVQADAELALNRTYGGIVRAATGQTGNCPAKDKDPVAWISFHRCIEQPELIVAIYPQFAEPQRKPWWRRLLS